MLLYLSTKLLSPWHYYQPEVLGYGWNLALILLTLSNVVLPKREICKLLYLALLTKSNPSHSALKDEKSKICVLANQFSKIWAFKYFRKWLVILSQLYYSIQFVLCWEAIVVSWELSVTTLAWNIFMQRFQFNNKDLRL